MTFEEHIRQMIADGYWHEKTLEPLKCEFCDSKNIDDIDHVVEELGTHVTTEYKKVCKNCGEEIGYWSYGHWRI